MRLFKFIKWWWNNNDEFNRIIACLIVFDFIPCGIAAIFYGAPSALLLGLLGAVALLCLIALYSVFCWLRDQWMEFDRKNPREDEVIIRRLKGDFSDSDRVG